MYRWDKELECCLSDNAGVKKHVFCAINDCGISIYNIQHIHWFLFTKPSLLMCLDKAYYYTKC